MRREEERREEERRQEERGGSKRRQEERGGDMGPTVLCCQCLLFIMYYVPCPVLVDECLLLRNTLMSPRQISPWGH